MQSTEEKRLQDEPGTSRGLTNGDSNANLLNGMRNNMESRGAIPKVKTVKTKTKKTKLNNNIEDVSENCSFILEINGSSGSVEQQEPTIDLTCDIRNFRLTNDSDDDNLSISDDGCIYTYKGDQDADLPVSFFSLDIPQEVAAQSVCRGHNYSPEMDYLEMDFDPGPGGACADGDYEPLLDQKTEVDDTNKELKVKVNNICNGELTKMEVIKEIVKKQPENSAQISEVRINNVDVDKKSKKTHDENKLPNEVFKNNLDSTFMPWSCPLEERTSTKSTLYSIKKYHLAIGELLKPNDTDKSSPIEDITSPDNSDESLMIWTPSEAKTKTVMQIGPSACGATAVLNALNALNYSTSVQKVQQNINTRLRKNSAPLTDYLLSRSTAGTTHEDIIDCIHKVTEGKVYARFFHMFPERIINLRRWLMFWLKNGAIPIATLNIQQAKKEVQEIPDAWHHQMIFGVSPKGIHFANPIECVQEDVVWSYLVSESVLLVRREDVVSRFNVQTDLPELMSIDDFRWRSMNVVGQVAHIIYQSRRELKNGFKNTPHIRIPASYLSGITIAIPVSSPAFTLLQQCPELPVLDKDIKGALQRYNV
nr:uncharacterized protein LOC111416758 [Onthophagus taurus]